MNTHNNFLVQQLPEGPLDIIGDIHGELESLENLLIHLGYDLKNKSNPNRTIVFVGDFCDRGPNSSKVILLVEQLVKSGLAVAVLGNHEVNLLNNDPKDGSGWFFKQRYNSDLNYYSPFTIATAPEKNQIIKFINTLPIVLERSDIRIVHATWHSSSVNKIRNVSTGEISNLHKIFRFNINAEADETGLTEKYKKDLALWANNLEDFNNPPPYLDSIAEYDALERKHNPIKVLTSGLEEKSKIPFFSGNRWRYSDRIPWWNNYTDAIPVVIGHYWRLSNPDQHQSLSRYSQLFNNLSPIEWHGALNNVFCVDYSVGAKWRDRSNKSKFRLAALRWPERTLVFDNGETCKTIVKD